MRKSYPQPLDIYSRRVSKGAGTSWRSRRERPPRHWSGVASGTPARRRLQAFCLQEELQKRWGLPTGGL
jgi:hypothetical protein